MKSEHAGTTAAIEREIKLPFESPAAARKAVAAVGAVELRARRLQDDRLLDWPDGRLRCEGCTLRVRQEAGAAFLTFKGPPLLAVMKEREELETAVGDVAALLGILDRLGLRVWFRYQKYREEFEHEGVIVAIDETPIGTFVELEGDARGIAAIASRMGRTAAEYVMDSYRGLFVADRADRKLAVTDMVFDPKP